jgi:hypothetical protein
MQFRRIQQTTVRWGRALRIGVALATAAVALMLPGTALATVPTATTQPATEITATSAVLHGVVNAQDRPGSWHFDYATDAEFGGTGTYPHSTLEQEIAFNHVPILLRDVSVSWTLTGLTSKTTYHFRVVASNTDGTTYGQDLTFKTLKK